MSVAFRRRSVQEAGFTLIEMLLSVAIIGILVGLSAPVYESFTRRNDLDLTAQTLTATLRRAALYARAGNSDTTWGVHVDSSAITLFQGADFASRNTNFDETTSVPGSIAASGASEVVFSKLTGAPQTTGTITLQSTTNDTRVITVNAKGMVSTT